MGTLRYGEIAAEMFEHFGTPRVICADVWERKILYNEIQQQGRNL